MKPPERGGGAPPPGSAPRTSTNNVNYVLSQVSRAYTPAQLARDWLLGHLNRNSGLARRGYSGVAAMALPMCWQRDLCVDHWSDETLDYYLLTEQRAVRPRADVIELLENELERRRRARRRSTYETN